MNWEARLNAARPFRRPCGNPSCGKLISFPARQAPAAQPGGSLRGTPRRQPGRDPKFCGTACKTAAYQRRKLLLDLIQDLQAARECLSRRATKAEMEHANEIKRSRSAQRRYLDRQIRGAQWELAMIPTEARASTDATDG